MIEFVQKWFLGWLGVYMHETDNKKHPFVDMFMRKFLQTKRLAKPSDQFVNNYVIELKRTKYWHGTGIYQYSGGEVVDTFASILKAGGLRPQDDVFDITRGNMSSVSCTKLRSYARIYADMHQYGGVNKSERCGAPFFWAYYYIISVALMAIKHMKLWINIGKRHAIANSLKDDMKTLWVKKVLRSRYVSLKDLFVNGSDIKDNFGVLIGIKDIVHIRETSPYISMYETRTDKTLSTDSWTHIEVPRKYIKLVSRILSQHKNDLNNLPIYAIEDCEAYFSQRSFSELVK